MPIPVVWDPEHTFRSQLEKRLHHERVARLVAPRGTARIVIR